MCCEFNYNVINFSSLVNIKREKKWTPKFWHLVVLLAALGLFALNVAK